MKNKTIIIVVDDNELDLLISSRMIGKVNPELQVKTYLCGHDVIKCLNESVEVCKSENIIFLIDVYMEKYTGFQLISELKQLFVSSKCTVNYYLLSASIDMGDLLRINADIAIGGFINKPLTVDLVKKLKT